MCTAFSVMACTGRWSGTWHHALVVSIDCPYTLKGPAGRAAEQACSLPQLLSLLAIRHAQLHPFYQVPHIPAASLIGMCQDALSMQHSLAQQFRVSAVSRRVSSRQAGAQDSVWPPAGPDIQTVPVGVVWIHPEGKGCCSASLLVGDCVQSALLHQSSFCMYALAHRLARTAGAAARWQPTDQIMIAVVSMLV